MEIIRYLQIAVWIFTGLVGLSYAYQALYILLPLLFGRTWPEDPAVSPAFRYIAVLIAARNEEAVLPHLLDSIREQDYPEDKVDVYVAADNCLDGTADAARKKGAVVYEREDREKTGKGWVLDWLLARMKEEGRYDRYDGFLILDADNLLDKAYLREINRTFCETENGAPRFDIITGYRNSKNFGENWLTAGYSLWFLHDSGHLNRSRHRLGLSCTLSGTGILLRRSLLDRLGGWPYHTLTEDLECTADRIAAGDRIGCCHDAVLYDEQPAGFALSIRQRIRWMQGGIQVSFRYGRAMCRGIRRLPGLKRKYACLENLTLSFFGYAAAAFGTLATLVMAGLTGTLLRTSGILLAGFLLSAWGMGLATLWTEGKRIHAGRGAKLCGVLCFPLFLAGFALSVLPALFSPREWKPIRHTAALSLAEATNRQSL